MATVNYTSLLGLALPTTGDLSGTWGNEVNEYLSKYVDSAVEGTQTISGSQTAVTLSVANGTALSQAGSGATGSAQFAIINCTGNPAGLLTITAPATSRQYIVINGTSTSQSVKIVGAGPTTGVTMVSGESAVVAWNGSDFVKVASSTADGVTTISFGSTGLTPSTATSGAVTVAGTLVAANGGTGQSSYTTGDLLYATGSTALSKLGIGTNGQILTSTGTAPQWSTLSGVAVTTFSAGTTGFTPSSATSGAITLAGTLATTNGGTGLTSFTANGVVYASSSSALTTGSALTFDGTNLGVGTSSPADKLQVLGTIRFGASATYYGTITHDASSTGANIYNHVDSGGHLFQVGGTTLMNLTASGNLGLGVTPSAWRTSSDRALQIGSRLALYTDSGITTDLGNNVYINASSQFTYLATAAATRYQQNAGAHAWYIAASGTAGNTISFTQALQITSAGFTQPLAYADTVSALGNTGTAKTIDLTTANVFTATLTGNCTFTLSSPIATGSSSFTLILTNDGTAGRTVAWSGGSFVFPGGAAALSRTTTANAVDVWVFFTPNGGTTWYGNIAMKNMTA